MGGGLNLYGFAGGDPVNFDDPFGLCQDAKTKQKRDCTVTWSDADNPNRNVDPRVMAAAQELATTADVDLVLSSGLRPGDPYNHGRGTALDISAIDGIDIGTSGFTRPEAVEKAAHVQNVLKGMPQIRENFGPSGLFKSTARGTPQSNYNDGSQRRAQLQREHKDHIHFSIQP